MGKPWEAVKSSGQKHAEGRSGRSGDRALRVEIWELESHRSALKGLAMVGTKTCGVDKLTTCGVRQNGLHLELQG